MKIRNLLPGNRVRYWFRGKKETERTGKVLSVAENHFEVECSPDQKRCVLPTQHDFIRICDQCDRQALPSENLCIVHEKEERTGVKMSEQETPENKEENPRLMTRSEYARHVGRYQSHINYLLGQNIIVMVGNLVDVVKTDERRALWLSERSQRRKRPGNAMNAKRKKKAAPKKVKGSPSPRKIKTFPLVGDQGLPLIRANDDLVKLFPALMNLAGVLGYKGADPAEALLAITKETATMATNIGILATAAGRAGELPADPGGYDIFEIEQLIKSYRSELGKERQRVAELLNEREKRETAPDDTAADDSGGACQKCDEWQDLVDLKTQNIDKFFDWFNDRFSTDLKTYETLKEYLAKRKRANSENIERLVNMEIMQSKYEVALKHLGDELDESRSKTRSLESSRRKLKLVIRTMANEYE